MIAFLVVAALHGVPPLSPLRVVRPYPSAGDPAGGSGVDLGGSSGQQVVSATAGTVTFAGPVAGRGVVTVTLLDGRRATYEPLVVGVARGTAVAAGAPIGRLSPGWPGCATAACLHWALTSGSGSAVTDADPMTLLGPRRVRLLPLVATSDDPSAGGADGADNADSADSAGAVSAPGPGSDSGSSSTSETRSDVTSGIRPDITPAAGAPLPPGAAVGGLAVVVVATGGGLAARRLRQVRRRGG